MKPRKLLLYGLLSPLILLLVSAPTPAVVFVDAARPDDTGNGLTWATAKKTIKAGVATAAGQPDLTVWVAKGTYTEAASIALPPGIQVYGGLTTADVPPFDLSTRTFVPPTIVQPTAGTTGNSIFVAQGDNVIDGFTIQNGAASAGAAIQVVNNASCTVGNCIIQNNNSATAGAGIYALADGTGATILVSRTKFKSNLAETGGAIYADGPKVLVSQSTFETNTAHFGGGICAMNGYLSISDGCTFSGNSAKDAAGKVDAEGGAIYASKTSVYVYRSTFGSNSAQVSQVDGGSAAGGAIAVYGGITMRVEGNIFDTCMATGLGAAIPTRFALGGAIYTKGVSVTFRNNIFARCSATGAGDPRPAFGGAIYYANPGAPDIRNNTFYANSVTAHAGDVTETDRPYGLGAAIFLIGSGPANVINNIISNSRGTAVVSEGMNVTFNYNLIWHNAGGDTYGITFPVYSTNAALNKDFNIMKDPQFRHAPSGDLHITYGSPARDTGFNSSAPHIDIDGEPRPFYSGIAAPPLVARVDIGADEFVDTDLFTDGGADNDPRYSLAPLGDGDGDGIENRFDNCPSLRNARQVDSNGDGIGDVCPNAAPKVYFVDNSLPPPPAWPAGPQPDGLTWATAFRSIQQAIDAADLHNLDLSEVLPGPPTLPWWTQNAQVWAKGGAAGQTYDENIAIWHGVAVYGAWRGPNPPTKPLGELPTDVPPPHSGRDLDANATTLDGGFRGTVVTIAHLPQDRYLSDPAAPNYDPGLKDRYNQTITVLDSFRVINGKAEVGGGVSVYKDLANVSTNRIGYNTAALGGGVYLYKSNGLVGDGWSAPPSALLTGSTRIEYNNATGPAFYAGYGGGLYTERGAPWVFANIFEGNRAYFGGAIASRASAVAIKENLLGCCTCLPRTNVATGAPDQNNARGGGVYIDFGSNVMFVMDTIVGNQAHNEGAQGGGIWSYNSNITMRNTILASNGSAGTGGAIWAGAANPAGFPWLTCPWCFIKYSDFYANYPEATAFVGLPDPTTPPVAGCESCPDTNLAIDPGFLNPADCDFRLHPLSPLRGAGDPSDGFPVPNIGAFQDIDPPVTVAQAKQLDNGITVEINEAVVTAVFDDGFYIEQPDRTSGVRVKLAQPNVKEGMMVTVTGITSTAGLEREIVSPQIEVLAAAGQPIKPLAIRNSDLGGVAIGPYIGNPIGSLGPNTLGLLVSTWGRVTEIVGGSAPGFMLDDGSGVGVKVIPAEGVTAPAVGQFITVTGISGATADATGKWTRAVRLRRASDMVCPQR